MYITPELLEDEPAPLGTPTSSGPRLMDAKERVIDRRNSGGSAGVSDLVDGSDMIAGPFACMIVSGASL